MEQKQRFIEHYLSKDCSMTALCKEYSISRKTGYQLIKAYEQRGIESIIPVSKKPHSSPQKTSVAVEELILNLRDKHPRWGGVKIRTFLLTEGTVELPSVQTINAILKRHGRITEAESEKHKPWIRFEHKAPNDLWQIDFKGFFALNNKSRCYPLTLLDDHSRYCLLIKACSNQTTQTVQSALTEVFRKVGLPKQMTMDNGTPWGYSGKQLHTQFCAWLMRLGITVKHSRPNHPQTQGKLERFHRTFKEELLSTYYFDHLDHAQEGFDWWLDIYNYQRPHGALALATPSTRYKPSDRPYIEHPEPYVYPEHVETFNVSVGGFIKYQNKRYRVGEGFKGERIGLVPEDNNLAAIYYCHQKILTLDLNNVS